jgi:hypothetical protein
MEIFREEIVPGYYRLKINPADADPAGVERLTRRFHELQRERLEEVAREQSQRVLGADAQSAVFSRMTV